MHGRLWQDPDKIGDSFTVSLAIPEKLYSDVAVFTPANHRYLNRQRDWFVSHGNLQREIGSCAQGYVASHLATGRREVQQDSFSCSGIALDRGRVADWDSRATSWLHE